MMILVSECIMKLVIIVYNNAICIHFLKKWVVISNPTDSKMKAFDPKDWKMKAFDLELTVIQG